MTGPLHAEYSAVIMKAIPAETAFDTAVGGIDESDFVGPSVSVLHFHVTHLISLVLDPMWEMPLVCALG